LITTVEFCRSLFV